MCSPVVLIGLSVLSKIMMKAFFFGGAAGDDGDDYDTVVAKARTFTHKWPIHRHICIDLYRFLVVLLPSPVKTSMLTILW